MRDIVVFVADQVTKVSSSSSRRKARPNQTGGMAIELVCAGSPIGCVFVERKAQYKGKWEQYQHRTSLDKLVVQHKRTVMGEINGNMLQLPFSTIQGFPLHEVHQIGRAAAGEPTLFE